MTGRVVPAQSTGVLDPVFVEGRDHGTGRAWRPRNGGLPRNTCCPAPSATSWAEDHVGIHGISGIGRDQRYALAGEAGSQFWIDEWEYPATGVYFASCPSAGHDMIAFDYRECGPDGEPCVVHVDQDFDYRITVLARDFVTFIQSLRPEEAYSTGP